MKALDETMNAKSLFGRRLRGVQSQLHVIDAKIKEVTAKRDVSVVTEKDVRKFIKEKHVPFIKKYSAENNFRAIIEELTDVFSRSALAG